MKKASINDENCRSIFAKNPMRWSVVIGYVIARARCQCVPRTILMLDDKLASHNEDDMAFVTPVVGNVFGAVIDKTKLDVATLAQTHRCRARLTRMHRRRKL